MTALPSARRQRTIAREATIEGIGFVTEADVRLRFLPARSDTGIVFRRVDLPGRPEIPARIEFVAPRPRRTALQRGEAVVEMTEHVLAALSGLQIDNCVIEINASETPGCDGSSQPFVEALLSAGLVDLERPRPALRIERPISLSEGRARLTALPADTDGLVLSYQLDYAPPIGSQSRFVRLSPDVFRDQLAPSRTFLLESEARAMRAAGLGRRLKESDLLIFGPDGPIANTLRFEDECVRHKLLDLVGDLALAGRDIQGHIVAHRSGHSLNARLVAALLAAEEPSARAESLRSPALDWTQILRLLPHRFPFLLVDRVLEIEGDQRIVAIKNVTFNEPYFQGHWPDYPLMPGVLVVEALAQTAGILLTRHYDFSGRYAVIAGIDGVRLRRPIVPGDQLEMEVTSRRFRPRMADVHGLARVAGQVAAEASIRFMLVELSRVA
ncbi:MAG: bifunctional enzyme LpxC/FabZ [Isosphaeraceae bacterium]|jgi:UDP-3-O-[3-hydroxymyristoyl] N-acetylglucosamine deacetylase/3-hydroxyacyl-[acyl-carrier-protein] dehydratase|nr:MAG: bifunctional enzyme LpxC/FabZ [Isosphaeraceae bacterium]